MRMAGMHLLHVVLCLLVGPSRAATHGCLKLDALTMDKMLSAPGLSFFVKIDEPYSFGEKADSFKTICQLASAVPNFFAAEVPVQRFNEKENDEVRIRFNLTLEDFPALYLFQDALGEGLRYTDAVQTPNMIRWLRSKGILMPSITSIDELDALVELFLRDADPRHVEQAREIAKKLGDSTGRKTPILLSFIGIVLFSVISASCIGFWSLALVRTMVGASFGLGQPSTLTMIRDITPSRWQVFAVSAVSSVSFCCGEIYSAALIWYNDPSMKELDWRWLCIMGAVPSIVGLVLSYSFLKESPAYLLDNGYTEEAKELIESYKISNGAEHVCCDLITSSSVARTPRSPRQNVEAILSPALRWTTLAMTYTCFILNVCFYGTLYAFPQVFADTSTPYSPAMALLVGALFEMPGQIAAPLCATVLDNKTILRMCPLGISIASLMFLVGANGEGMLYGTLLQVGYAGIKITVGGFFAVAYTCASGVFPTAVRSTGTAACVAGGRIGGILSPLIFEQMVIAFDGWGGFFILMIVGLLLNSIILMALNLEDVDDINSLEELKPMISNEEKAVA